MRSASPVTAALRASPPPPSSVGYDRPARERSWSGSSGVSSTAAAATKRAVHRKRAQLRGVAAATLLAATALWLLYPPLEPAGVRGRARQRQQRGWPVGRASASSSASLPAADVVVVGDIELPPAHLGEVGGDRDATEGSDDDTSVVSAPPPPPPSKAPPTAPSSDSVDPGPEPHPRGNLSAAENAAMLTDYELRRIRYVRARYFNAMGVEGAGECLAEGEEDDSGVDAWRMNRRTGRGEDLPFTEETQRAIYTHQHPADCKAARFLVWRLWNQGMGADLHKLGDALHVAMQTGRVLILDANFTWWYAMDRQPALLDCFFTPLTNCTMEDVGAYEVLPANFRVNKKGKLAPVHHAPVAKYGDVRALANPLHIAGYMHSSFSKSPRYDDFGPMWWYAQSLRYALRQPRAWLWRQYRTWVDEVFPNGPPSKLLGIHVRHGDKKTEMRLRPLQDYMDVANGWQAADPSLRDIFISTEDDAVLEETKAHANWRFHWTKHLRYDKGSPMDYAMRIGPSKLAEISFVNLLINEQLCTHWIATDQSNWNRMINELRMTNGKMYQPYHQLNRLDCQDKEKPFDPPVPGWRRGCP